MLLGDICKSSLVAPSSRSDAVALVGFHHPCGKEAGELAHQGAWGCGRVDHTGERTAKGAETIYLILASFYARLVMV